jgi:hypothetical protein
MTGESVIFNRQGQENEVFSDVRKRYDLAQTARLSEETGRRLDRRVVVILPALREKRAIPERFPFLNRR